MNRECRKSCGQCAPESDEDEDDEDDIEQEEDEDDAKEMDRLAMQKKKYDGLLLRARRVAAMSKATACHDRNGECPVWQRLGECMHNPEYMLSECKVSCGVCIDRDSQPEVAAAAPAAAQQRRAPDADAMPAASSTPVTIATAATSTASGQSGDVTMSPGMEPNLNVAQSVEVAESVKAMEVIIAPNDGGAAKVGMKGEAVDLKAPHGDPDAESAEVAADGAPAAEPQRPLS